MAAPSASRRLENCGHWGVAGQVLRRLRNLHGVLPCRAAGKHGPRHGMHPLVQSVQDAELGSRQPGLAEGAAALCCVEEPLHFLAAEPPCLAAGQQVRRQGERTQSSVMMVCTGRGSRAGRLAACAAAACLELEEEAKSFRLSSGGRTARRPPFLEPAAATACR